MTRRKADIADPVEGTAVWNQQETAKKLGKSPDTFRNWKNSKSAERFNRVVIEVEPNKYNAHSVMRYLNGAAM